jgi:hypothetical protein
LYNPTEKSSADKTSSLLLLLLLATTVQSLVHVFIFVFEFEFMFMFTYLPTCIARFDTLSKVTEAKASTCIITGSRNVDTTTTTQKAKSATRRIKLERSSRNILIIVNVIVIYKYYVFDTGLSTMRSTITYATI